MGGRFGLEVVALSEPEEVYRGADIISGCTDAVGPVVLGRFIEPGTHVTCIGGRPDADAFARFDRWIRLADATVPYSNPSWATQEEFVAYRASEDDPVWRQLHHGDRRWQPPSDPARVVSLRQILDGKVSARGDDRDVTFSERGNAQGAQFHAVAGLIYEKALARGLGREIPTEWLMQDIRN